VFNRITKLLKNPFNFTRSVGRFRPVGVGLGFRLWIFEAGASIYSSTERPRPVGIGSRFVLWLSKRELRST